MKIVRVSSVFPAYSRGFYAARPGLDEADYERQQAELELDAFSWAGAWTRALNAKGVEAVDFYDNIEPLQRAWNRKRGQAFASGATLDADGLLSTALEQVSGASPDVLWFDSDDKRLLRAIRERCPDMRLVLGWVGSALPPREISRDIDLMLSCAPESVETLRAKGRRCEHLHHGFDPQATGRLRPSGRAIELSFIGQIIRAKDFHFERERILETLARKTPVQIFCPALPKGAVADAVRTAAKLAVYEAAHVLRGSGVPAAALERVPLVRNALGWRSRPALSVSRELRPLLRLGAFGIEMLQILKDSKVNLNIHADSSPRFASNMRLFEATGVGSCLLTDWRPNLSELFDVGREIVAYEGPEDCAEKARWLLDHPAESAAIAEAGHKRALKDHTIERRSERFLEIVQREIGR